MATTVQASPRSGRIAPVPKPFRDRGTTMTRRDASLRSLANDTIAHAVDIPRPTTQEQIPISSNRKTYTHTPTHTHTD